MVISRGAATDFRRLLLERRVAAELRLTEGTRELEEIRAARDSTADDEHDPEGSTLAADWSRIVGLRADAEVQLAAIDAALGRLEVGRFGVCAACGRDIPIERLRARPTAEMCVDCASR